MFRKSLAGLRVGLVLLVALIAAAPARAIVYIDDTAAGWDYEVNLAGQGWVAATGVVGAISMTEHWSNANLAKAEYTCTSTNAFTLVYSSAPNRGKAHIYVFDSSGHVVGSPTGEMWDMYSPTVVRQVHRSWYLSGQVPIGTYTIYISVSGNKNPAATDDFVSIDAIYGCAF